MAGIISSSGSTKKTQAFLESILANDLFEGLQYVAQQGVSALSMMTPIDTGVTASSWGYEIDVNSDYARITWTNNHIDDGVNVAIILQYGHATGTGGYVSGYDYINPAMQPIFEQIAEELWRRVTQA